MKKRRYLIPICLFVGVALLVGRFFLVRWWLRPEREATAESSSSYTLELRDLYSEEVFAQHESSDGAAFTLQNVSGN